MLNTILNKTDHSNASAKVVDGKLILSFPEAVSPILWQMDLAQSKASALEITHNTEENTSTLVLKTPKGENVDIATFKNRQDAMDAFMATSSALKNAYGQIRTIQEVVANDAIQPYRHKPQKRIGAKKWIAALIGLILIVTLFNMWGTQLPRTPSSVSSTSSSSSSIGNAPPPSSNGVPMSADAFLNAR